MSTYVKARPILFSTAMVRALLARTKRQTRRITKPQPIAVWSQGVTITDAAHYSAHVRLADGAGVDPWIRCPYGKAGDLLWVRETWGVFRRQPGTPVYRADDENALGASNAWRPSIHMRRSYSRLTLRITDVRLERLHEISEDDAIAEGIDQAMCVRLTTKSPWVGHVAPAAVHAYAALWDQINGDGAWLANPWVWVVAFEVNLQNVNDVLRQTQADP
jgi:hypothetical protein